MEEKRKIQVEVNYPLNWKYGVDISVIKKDIEELEKLGANIVIIDCDNEYGDCIIEIKAISERMETDDEYKKRIFEQNKRDEEIKKRELEQFERIKLKYGL